MSDMGALDERRMIPRRDGARSTALGLRRSASGVRRSAMKNTPGARRRTSLSPGFSSITSRPEMSSNWNWGQPLFSEDGRAGTVPNLSTPRTTVAVGVKRPASSVLRSATPDIASRITEMLFEPLFAT